MSNPTTKIKLTRRWGEYGPGTELNLPDWLASKLLEANICCKSEPVLDLRQTAEAPPVETAAITSKPAPGRPACPSRAADRRKHRRGEPESEAS